MYRKQLQPKKCCLSTEKLTFARKQKIMISIDPKEVSTVKLQGYLQGAVGPRPIALASTLDENGNPNLSPFSFFNVFSSNPPILVFSPARRVRNNTVKHTLINVQQTKEVVISVVNYDIVQQVSLASTEYADGVDEFIKSGLTPIKSDVIKPFRVAESPVQFECVVKDIIALGDNGGAGNLVICKVVRIHVSEEVLDENGAIDQYKIDLVSRMGGNWYSRANKGLFEVPKPLVTLGIGVDAIPDFIKKSEVFSGNDLGILGNIEILPTQDEITNFVNQSFEAKAVLSSDDSQKVYQKAKDLLAKEQVLEAWMLLLASQK